MPNVTPTVNDTVQIKIRGAGGSYNEQFITAEIVALQETTYWNIKVPGDPELIGTIDIRKYQWDHKQTRWLPKEPTVQPTKTIGRVVADTELEIPSRIIADTELEIPRTVRVPYPLTPGVKNWSDADS